MKKSFVLYHDQHECIEDLTNDQKGQLLDMMFFYGKGEDLPECEPVVKLAFKFFKIVFDRDNVKWEKKAKRSKENGKKGGRPKGKKNNNIEETHNNPEKPSGLNKNPEKPVSGNVSSNGSANVNASASHVPENPLDVSRFSNEIVNLVNDFQNYISKEKGKRAPDITDKLIFNCSDTVDKLIRLDKFTFDEVRQALQWGVEDEFYSGQLFSLASLREKKNNGNTKFQNLYNQYINTLDKNKPDLLNQEFDKLRSEHYGQGNTGGRVEIS